MGLLWKIYITFFKIGCFTIGGGYAMIPIIEHEVVKKLCWVEKDEMVDFIAIAQSVPGVIGINTATLVGYKVGGVVGAVVATLGMVTPSFFIIIIIALLFSEFQKSVMVQKAFKGIRSAVIALIVISVLNIGKNSVKEISQLAVVIICAIAIVGFKISPVIMIVFGGCFGLLKRRRI